MDVQRIRDYYKQLYANKMDNLEEMDQFLEKYNLPRLNQEGTENMNWNCDSKTSNKSPGPDGLTDEFYQALRQHLTPILLKSFQKTAKEGILPSSFYEATITLIPKPKIPQKWKLQELPWWSRGYKSTLRCRRNRPDPQWGTKISNTAEWLKHTHWNRWACVLWAWTPQVESMSHSERPCTMQQRSCVLQLTHHSQINKC